MYFDLTGLPPSPAEVEAFVKDKSSSAYETLVDRLLDSPRFGERMAQVGWMWCGSRRRRDFEYDRHLPDAWRYRDYVIDAFNRDKPFDQFVTRANRG